MIEEKQNRKKNLKHMAWEHMDTVLPRRLHKLGFTNVIGNSLQQLTLLLLFTKRSYNSEWLSLVLRHVDGELKNQDQSSDSFVSKTCALGTTHVFIFTL